MREKLHARRDVGVASGRGIAVGSPRVLAIMRLTSLIPMPTSMP